MPALKGSVASGNSLLVLVVATVFLVPWLPVSWHWLLYNLLGTGIYFLAVKAVTRHRRLTLPMAVTGVVLEWFSDLVDLPLLGGVSGAINVLFFIVIVILLIAQIARSKRVSGRQIVESINAYILLGMMFTLLVTLLAEHQPEAYSFSDPGARLEVVESHASDYSYYAFVTMTTVGYGDLLPLTSQSKSLAVLIGMTGQLYLAVILAMLVGKFASRRWPDGEE